MPSCGLPALTKTPSRLPRLSATAPPTVSKIAGGLSPQFGKRLRIWPTARAALTMGKDFSFTTSPTGSQSSGIKGIFRPRDFQSGRFMRRRSHARNRNLPVTEYRGVTLSYSVGRRNLASKASASHSEALVFHRYVVRRPSLQAKSAAPRAWGAIAIGLLAARARLGALAPRGALG
jgi:hypothetical protein